MQRAHRGFSMIELMAVLAVALVLLGVAVPSYRSFIESQRLTAAANEFLAAIYLARSEAIQRGERVDLVAVGGNWRNGWTVFVDKNRNRQPDQGDEVVTRHEMLANGIDVGSALQDNGGNYLAYNGSGRSRTHASGQQPQFGSIRFRLGAQRRNIVINMVGRPRICTPRPGSESC
jgi:type IV fimbrial biogenesis protein FimT